MGWFETLTSGVAQAGLLLALRVVLAEPRRLLAARRPEETTRGMRGDMSVIAIFPSSPRSLLAASRSPL